MKFDDPFKQIAHDIAEAKRREKQQKKFIPVPLAKMIHPVKPGPKKTGNEDLLGPTDEKFFPERLGGERKFYSDPAQQVKHDLAQGKRQATLQAKRRVQAVPELKKINWKPTPSGSTVLAKANPKRVTANDDLFGDRDDAMRSAPISYSKRGRN